MNLRLNQHNLKALLCVVPKNSLSCEDELRKLGYNDTKIAFFGQNYGYKKAHITDENTYALELCAAGLQGLFDAHLARKDELDALIIATHTMDYFAPSLSYLVHNKLALNPKTLCFDKIGFCTSFINSLFEAFLLLENKDIQRLALICVSIKSKKKNPADTLNFISDSASVALIERANLGENSAFKAKNSRESVNFVEKMALGESADFVKNSAFGADFEAAQKCFYKSELLSDYALDETKSLSAYRKGFGEFVNIDNKLIFQVAQKEFPRFFEDFCVNFGLKSADFTQFFFNSSNSFFHQKLVQSLNLDENLCFCEAYKTYANADCNNIPLNLCLMSEMTGGGGGEPYL